MVTAAGHGLLQLSSHNCVLGASPPKVKRKWDLGSCTLINSVKSNETAIAGFL